jgi:hypothetical protein
MIVNGKEANLFLSVAKQRRETREKGLSWVHREEDKGAEEAEGREVRSKREGERKRDWRRFISSQSKKAEKNVKRNKR